MWRRWGPCLLLAALLPCSGQLREREEPPPELPQNMEDEDEDLSKQPEYVFNPIQAKKELKIGDFYARKGSHRAAARRYLEATRWDPAYAEAFWKLARSREELDEVEEALEAYRKYVDLDPKGKYAHQAREKMARLDKEKSRQEDPATDNATN